MKKTITLTYPAGPERVAAMLADPDYQRKRAERADLSDASIDVAVREAIDNGDVRGPRVVASGPQITTTAGHSYHAGAEVDSLDQIRYEVRHHHKMGVDTIKVMATGGFMTGGSAPWFAQFSQGELDVLIAEAHRLGKWTAAHAHGVQGIERAVRAGVDYVKTATGSQGFPTEAQVQVMRDNITNDNTKLKVSGVPRTFTMPATLWMIEQLGVSLIGTRSAASLVQQYAAHLGTN